MKSFEEIMKVNMEIYDKNREKLMGHPRFSEERYLKNTEKEVKDILNLFNEKNIDFEIEIKDGWGLIYVFEIRGNKVFAPGFKKGKLDLYYYSEEYSCKGCRLKF
jgi:hypothetical protein